MGAIGECWARLGGFSVKIAIVFEREFSGQFETSCGSTFLQRKLLAEIQLVCASLEQLVSFLQEA